MCKVHRDISEEIITGKVWTWTDTQKKTGYLTMFQLKSSPNFHKHVKLKESEDDGVRLYRPDWTTTFSLMKFVLVQ